MVVAAAGVGAAVCAAGWEGAAALPHAAAVRPMPVIMALMMIRFGLAAIGFLMRSSLFAETEAGYSDRGGSAVRSVPRMRGAVGSFCSRPARIWEFDW